VLAFTGMRAGECQHLLPEDVDLDGGWIHIISREGAETKTRESRKVPLHARLTAILRQLPKSRGLWYFTAQPSRNFPVGDHHLGVKHLTRIFKSYSRS
jgi:integrase